MRISIENAARRLGVPLATLERWARQGRFPLAADARRTIDERELTAWARDHDFRLLPATDDPEAESAVRLRDALEAGAQCFGLQARSPEDCIERLLELTPLPSGTESLGLLQRVLERESMASTGIGHGIALPHPRSPVEALPAPLISYARLDDAVDFRAADGRLVEHVFLLLSPSTRAHLQLLSKLARLLRDEAGRTRLGEVDSRAALFELAAAADCEADGNGPRG